MSLETYLAFIVAVLVLFITPGPDMLLQLTRTMSNGRKAGFYTAFGINVGIYIHLIASFLGISAVIAASATAFMVIKYIGVAYLIYLGVQALKDKRGFMPKAVGIGPERSSNYFFRQGVLCNLMNPKAILFYMAFLPQFINPADDNHNITFLILGVTIAVISALESIALVIGAETIAVWFRSRPRVSIWFSKAIGTLFITFGLRLATEKVS